MPKAGEYKIMASSKERFLFTMQLALCKRLPQGAYIENLVPTERGSRPWVRGCLYIYALDIFVQIHKKTIIE
jgi:hypothetical protein